MMNSHSSRSRNYELTGSFHKRTKTDFLIDISGEEFRNLMDVEWKPINLEEMRKDYVDPSGHRRSAQRYNVNMKVLLVTPHQIFQTEILNISRSGMMLKEFVPDQMLRSSFDIVLVNQDAQGQNKYMIFRGHMVGAPLRSGRIAFDAMKNSSEQQLIDILSDLTVAA